MKLGDLFREYDKHSQALRIHQSLTVRPDISRFERLQVLRSLVLDYEAMGFPDRAVETANQILELDRGNLWGRERLLRLHKKKMDWSTASRVARELQKQRGSDESRSLALYRIQEGLASERAGDSKEAQNLYKKALKTCPGYAPAYYYLGESYLQDGERRLAADAWKKFAEHDAEHAYIVFERLEAVLYDLGKFDEVESVYRKVLERIPGQLDAVAALADFYERRGELREAAELTQAAVERDPGSVRAHSLLVKILHKDGEASAVREQIEAIVEVTKRRSEVRCQECGYVSEEPLWLCPSCEGEETFLL